MPEREWFRVISVLGIYKTCLRPVLANSHTVTVPKLGLEAQYRFRAEIMVG